MDYPDAIDLITDEFITAKSRYPSMQNPHEGYALILEELDELWDAIKKNQYSKDLKDEAKQVGAMALRFLIDCC